MNKAPKARLGLPIRLLIYLMLAVALQAVIVWITRTEAVSARSLFGVLLLFAGFTFAVEILPRLVADYVRPRPPDDQ